MYVEGTLMTAKPKVIWDIEASSFVRQPDSYIGSSTFGDKGYLFHATITDTLVPIFSNSIKTYRLFIREHNRKKETSEYMLSVDKNYYDTNYARETILREVIRKVKANNIEPLDFYK